MQLPTLAALLTATATLASAGTLAKRCSPRRDPDLPGGFYPPAPCWQTFSPACQPFLASGTEMTLDAAQGLAVVYGVSEHCAAQIAEEIAREADGRKNFNWLRDHGQLTVIEPSGNEERRILVISGMSERAVDAYAQLTYMGPPFGTGP